MDIADSISILQIMVNDVGSSIVILYIPVYESYDYKSYN